MIKIGQKPVVEMSVEVICNGGASLFLEGTVNSEDFGESIQHRIKNFLWDRLSDFLQRESRGDSEFFVL